MILRIIKAEVCVIYLAISKYLARLTVLKMLKPFCLCMRFLCAFQPS